MLQRRLLAALFAAVLLTTGACATESGTPSGGDQKEVTFVGPIAVPVWLQARDGFVAEAERLGLKANWFAPASVEIPTIVQALQDALNSGVDGLATCALDPNAFEPVLRDAQAKNVPVVLVDCDVPDQSLRLAFVGTIGDTFGEASGRKLVELTGGTGKVLVMQGQFDAQIQNDILAGFMKGIEGTDIEVLAREADNSDVQIAVSKFEQLFRTYPDADIVYCIEAGCAGAAATVAKETGREMLIFGTDDNPETLDGIRDGTIAISAAQPFKKMGQLAAQFLADEFAGRTVPSVTDTGVVFITKSNVDTYLND